MLKYDPLWITCILLCENSLAGRAAYLVDRSVGSNPISRN